MFVNSDEGEYLGSAGTDPELLEVGIYTLFDAVTPVCAKEICTLILKHNLVNNENNTPINLIINTPGGYTSDGFAIIDMMSLSKKTIRTVGLGQIASMGLLILSAGAKGNRVLLKNCEVMAHQFIGGSSGKLHEMNAIHESNKILEHKFIDHFVRTTKLNEKKVRDILFGPSERWLTPEECKKYGLCDKIAACIEDVII